MIILYIVAPFLCLYIRFIVLFYFHLKEQNHLSVKHHVPVTIICSARNEERNISNFLNGILNQNYDNTLIQLIIIDDGSTDNTFDILRSYQDKFYDYLVLQSKDRDNAISAKKNALSQAIANAKNDIILTSDADCIPQSKWVNGMVNVYLNTNADMVIGFSETDTKDAIQQSIDHNKSVFLTNKWVRLFEYIDFHILMFATSASVNAQKYFSCSGQNLSFKLTAFKSVGGYQPIMRYISGDDLHLMQLFRKNKKKIVFANNLDARVQTGSISSFSRLINQRSRWASNMKYMLNSNLEFFFYLISVFLILTLLPALLFLEFKIGLMLILVKLVMDWIFINKGMKCFHIKRRYQKTNNDVLKGFFNRLGMFLIWSLLQPFYVLIVSIFGCFSLFKWKDRKGYTK